jgi:hypothetical protein
MIGQAGRRNARETPERMSSGIPQQRKWSAAKSGTPPNPLLFPFAMQISQCRKQTPLPLTNSTPTSETLRRAALSFCFWWPVSY